MKAQDNREFVPPLNPNVGTKKTTIRYCTKMNPLEFHKLERNEDPKK